jgi:hypothetical protein
MKLHVLVLCLLLSAYQTFVCKLSDVLVKSTGDRIFILPYLLPPSVFVWTDAANIVLKSRGYGGE